MNAFLLRAGAAIDGSLFDKLSPKNLVKALP
jgi:hypothetical protein